MIFEVRCTPTPNRLGAGEEVMITYKAIVGPGARVGDGINRANVVGQSVIGPARSNPSSAKVHIVQGVFTDRAILIGKVFIDLNEDGEQDNGEPGVPGVRLVMEDGTSATTDEQGKYSLYGLKSTTHVLKVDPLTLPDLFILHQRPNSFADDPETRFFDLMEGELHKVNFAIAPLSKEIWEPIIYERKERFSQQSERLLGISTPNVSGVPPRSSNNEYGGQTPLAEVAPLATDMEGLAFSTVADLPGATNGSEPLAPRVGVDLAIVSPNDQEIIPIQSTDVIATGFSSLDFRLIVNDQPIGDRHVGRVVVSKERPVAAIEWIAVPLNVGQNEIKVQGWDSFGNMREEVLRTVFVPGDAERISIEANPAVLFADLTSTSTLTIRIFDRDSVPVLTRSFLTVTTSHGRFVGHDLDPNTPGLQIAIVGGETSVRLIAGDQVGDTIVTAHFGNGKENQSGQVIIPHLPPLREMIAVGVLDAKINIRNFKGKIQPVTPDDRFSESLTGDGRSALYLKGKVASSTLLTLSYDSDKKETEPLFRDIQPDTFYPIYGDASVKGFDAQSTGRLYVKVEQKKSYLLFGDFSPDFSDHELLRYQRSLSGLKYHFEDEQSKITAFHSRSQQKQVVDRIPANGTSGFYLLTQSPIVENSDIGE
jgi:hypothetical protein